MGLIKKIILITSITISSFCWASTKPLTILLDWYPNPDHAPLFVAEEAGFFKQEGIEVKLISPTNPDDPLKMVAAGKADIAVTYQPALMLAVDAGIPVLRIGTLVATPLNAVAVLQSSDIRSIQDLKGKKIGYSMDGTDHIMLNTMLVSAGLTQKDVTLINVHYGLTQALMQGNVDAVTGIMRNFEPIEMAEQGKPVRIFKYEEYGIPLYDELIYVSRKQEINDPRLGKFLTALTLATDYLMKHPEASWKVFAKAHPELNNTFNRKAWFATLPYFALHPVTLDSNRYQNFALYLQQNQVIKTVPPLDNYAVEIRT